MALPLRGAADPQFVDLVAACPVVPGATVSKPVMNAPQGKVVVFAMDAGQEISEHRAPFVATVHVLGGRVRLGINGVEREMAANDWLIMPADAPHRLAALEPAHFVLTLFKG